MTDIELTALTVLVRTETEAMVAANQARSYAGHQMAYEDDSFLSLDCVRCLDAELRDRGVLVTPGAKP